MEEEKQMKERNINVHQWSEFLLLLGLHIVFPHAAAYTCYFTNNAFRTIYHGMLLYSWIAYIHIHR